MHATDLKPRSRRALLAGAMGGIAALAVDALRRPTAVDAANGDIMTVGSSHSATSTTRISLSGSDATTFLGITSGAGVGLYGQSNGGGISVFGYNPGGGVGIQGTGYSDAPGVIGSSSTAPGAPSRPTKTGVFGWAIQDADARGVHGQSTSGRGVYGQATTGRGVSGYATSGTAVYGTATTGYALRTVGRVRFERSSGIVTIGSGKSSALVDPGFDVTPSTGVVATLNGNAGGTTAVERVFIDAAANTFTIHLTGAAAAPVRVAWLVLS